MICLSRSDLNSERFEKSKETRTNYNKLITVQTGKIICYDGGEYNLTDLCYDNGSGQYCTLATGKRIQLRPE